MVIKILVVITDYTGMFDQQVYYYYAVRVVQLHKFQLGKPFVTIESS